ncbi:hypothetical protein [Streptomyces sp. YS415]|uniref:hypothetical protein n=1 Tax=Streptomyces sp. YS415 TaxID=2944806 RepID=UPI0020213B3D|nr:hypothetical protein [Streptomyces sp. YS415]MCL7429823.1 hypothetical protein [Streptomyces sp. YS415]
MSKRSKARQPKPAKELRRKALHKQQVTISAHTLPSWSFAHESLGLRRQRFSNGLRIMVYPDGSIAPAAFVIQRVARRSTLRRSGTVLVKQKRLRASLTKPLSSQYVQQECDVFQEAPPLVIALMARQDALQGDFELVDRFAAQVLRRRTTGDWRTALSDALLGDWINPLQSSAPLHPSALVQLRNRVWRIHADLQPIWTRRTSRSRVLLLDTPLGADLTLHDLLAASPSAAGIMAGEEPDDARLGALLRVLDDVDRTIVLAWMHPGVATWADAALLAGASRPEADGERVRRRVRRLVADQQRRAAASEGLWLPGTAGR